LPPSKQKKKQAYARGVFSEKMAALFLRAKGYKILAQRYRTPHGEIDLVTKKNNCLVFVEVKARKTLEDGLYSILPKQQQRIMAAAEMWIAEKGVDFEGCRFDVVLLTPKGLPTHIKNAFMQE